MAKKRKKGEGTLRHRKDGRWEGENGHRLRPGGQPQDQKCAGKDEGRVRGAAGKLKATDDTKRPVKVKADMAFGDWLDFWYQNHSKPGLRPTTCQSYENWLYDHLIPGVGHIPLSKLTQSDLQQFFTDMKRNGRHTQVES